MTGLQALKRLSQHLSARRKRQMMLVVVLMLAGAVAEVMTVGAIVPFLAFMADPEQVLAYPQLQSVFARLGWQNASDLLLPTAILFMASAVLAGFTRIILTWVSNRFIYGLGNDLNVALYRKTLYQPYAYHVSSNSSDAIGRLNKVQIVLNEIVTQIIRAFIGLTIAIFIIAALIYINPLVAMISIAGFGAIYAVITLVSRGFLRHNSKIIAETQSSRVQAVQEGMGGIRDVILERAEPQFVNKFQALDRAFQQAQMRNSCIVRIPRFALESLGMVLIAAIAMVAIGGGGSLAAGLPALGALALGAQRLLPLVQLVYQGWAQFAGNRSVLKDVLDRLDMQIPPARLANRDASALPFEDRITLDHVSFGYLADRDPVLRDVSVEIPKGSVIGLIGKTGSGKSTSVDLIMGLLEPTNGSISVDGHELDADSRLTWQRNIANVPQMTYLADASLAENIAFGIDPDQIDMARVEDAAARAQVAEYIVTLPDGYETSVGERGIRLSGGQRQRIGIARALYRQASVLVFDEATSALDNETEAAVIQSICARDDRVTIIMIAHRLSTLATCDLIVRLDNGQVIETGDYQTVVVRGQDRQLMPGNIVADDHRQSA